jgi:hypothetical protein
MRDVVVAQRKLKLQITKQMLHKVLGRENEHG